MTYEKEAQILADKLEVIADKLGIAIVKIFEIFTHSIRGMAIIDLVTSLFVIFGVMITVWYMINITKKRNAESEYEEVRKRTSLLKFDESDVSPIIFLTLALLLILSFIGSVINSILSHYLYPEYFAIEKMLNIIGK